MSVRVLAFLYHIWRVVFAYLRKGALEALSYRLALVVRLGSVALSFTALYYFSRFIDSGGIHGSVAEASVQRASRIGGYFPYGLAGAVLLNLQHTFVSAYPLTIRAAQVAGTLEAVMATPTPSWLILVAAPVYRLIMAYLSALAALALGSVILRLDVATVDWGGLIAAFSLGPIAFASLGLIAAALTIRLRRSDPLSLFVGGISTLTGGVFYPTSVLPPMLRRLGSHLPITHALALIRHAAFSGEKSAGALRASLFALSGFCLCVVPVGLVSFSWVIRRSRRDGSLGHY